MRIPNRWNQSSLYPRRDQQGKRQLLPAGTRGSKAGRHVFRLMIVLALILIVMNQARRPEIYEPFFGDPATVGDPNLASSVAAVAGPRNSDSATSDATSGNNSNAVSVAASDTGGYLDTPSMFDPNGRLIVDDQAADCVRKMNATRRLVLSLLLRLQRADATPVSAENLLERMRKHPRKGVSRETLDTLELGSLLDDFLGALPDEFHAVEKLVVGISPEITSDEIELDQGAVPEVSNATDGGQIAREDTVQVGGADARESVGTGNTDIDNATYLRLQAALDQFYQSKVQDGGSLVGADADAMYRYLERDAAVAAEMDRVSTSVGVVQLMQQPNSYAGRVVHVNGRVARVIRRDAANNLFDVPAFHEVWLRPKDGSDRPVILYTQQI
ncbi:MAG: hypothetical protein AAFP69_19505, partial [Planctomycetota bacterium]